MVGREESETDENKSKKGKRRTVKRRTKEENLDLRNEEVIKD